MPKFATPYGERVRVQTENNFPSATQQQFASEADVNVLIARYEKTGSFYNPLTPQVGEVRRPMFEDVSAIPSVEEAQQTILEVQEIFGSLPSRVRERFGHNPAVFVEWAQNPANLPALAKLGVIELPKQEPSAEGDQPAPAVEAHKQGAAAGGDGSANGATP